VTAIGILAFGSLIDDPGSEIESVRVDQRIVQTPFRVEFARYSEKRNGAPTLVPVEQGGAHVAATLLMLAEHVHLREAKNMLWRRETWQIGTGKEYHEIENPSPNKVLVCQLDRFEGVDAVLYVDFPTAGKVIDATPDELAEKAISSAKARNDDKDGISYLLQVKSSGITTPFMLAYEGKILQKTGTGSLEEALERLRNP
jgi:hypothetical protein